MMQVALEATAKGQRLDVAVAAASGISRNQIHHCIKSGLVAIDGQTVINVKQEVQGGEVVTISEPTAQAAAAVPELTILYEDDDVLVIDKPAGLVVHASESGRIQPTVAAFAHARGVEDKDTVRPGIVHRLDKDTSGVMIIAKNEVAKEFLQRQFRKRSVDKHYLALVRGRMTEAEAEIRLPVGRDRRAPVKRAVVPGAREAITAYRVAHEYPGASLVEIGLKTGRTHQIRVHFSHLGHPVVGDTLYGEAKGPAGLSRQFLHASSLSIELPSGQRISVVSPLPPELKQYLQHLGSAV
jgi:23S rRNA pseudouridine1911/1915/1917 synthase